MQRFSLYRVHKVLARMDGTTAALLYPHRNALRGDKKYKDRSTIFLYIDNDL